jgi:hypothetical protein
MVKSGAVTARNNKVLEDKSIPLLSNIFYYGYVDTVVAAVH